MPPKKTATVSVSTKPKSSKSKSSKSKSTKSKSDTDESDDEDDRGKIVEDPNASAWLGRAGKIAKGAKKIKDAAKAWDNKLKNKIKEYKQQTKYDKNFHYKLLGGVQLPSMVSNFFRSNTARFKILVRSMEVLPVEFTINFFHEINHVAIIAFIGFLLISLWMVFEEIALYASRDVLGVILYVISEISVWLEVILAVAVVFLLGPTVWALQALVCVAEEDQIMPDNPTIKGICDNIPEFYNVDFAALFERPKMIPGFWDFMATSKTTCAEFSTGLEELQVMPKLILSPFICPIMHHVRPVKWLYDMFWYTLGWATWEQGIERTYEAPWAQAVTHQTMTQGINNNRKCEPPPNALFCFILGFGFLVVEIIVPLLVLMLGIKPLKDAVSAVIGIAISVFYYSINFVLWFIEEATHVLEWAGRKFAWLVVLLAPLCITAPSFMNLYGEDGLFMGCVLGIMTGLLVVIEHTPNEKDLGGVSHGTIMIVAGVAAALLAGGGVLNRYV